MKTLILIALLLFVSEVKAQHDLVLEVTLNRPAAGGTLRLVLCSTKAAFDTEKGCTLKQVKAEGAVVRIVFPGLADGDYAIKAFHDVNDNGSMDTNWMGIPKEPYGFSNDAMGNFGPPSFEQAQFKVKAGSTTARFRMKG